MLSWLIPKEFCCGLICAGILKNLNTSTVLHARLVYICLSLFFGLVSLFVKVFAQDAYGKLGFLMPNCLDGLCFSSHIIHAVMLSLAIFHFLVLGITMASDTLAFVCYQKCWVLKFLLYFVILFICVWTTSVLDYYFWIALVFAVVFICLQSVYLIEFNYDWNDTWFDNYSNSSSQYWAVMLISFSVISWVLNIGMLIVAYMYSKYFWVSLGGFFAAVVITVFSSSALCENGSLLSSSVTMTYASYFLTSALVVDPKDQNYLILGLDVLLSVLALVYLAFTVPDKIKTNGHHELNQTEMKNFGNSSKEIEESKVEDNEKEDQPRSNNTLFQSAIGCYCLFLGMVLTNWEWDLKGNSPLIAKCAQAGMCMGFYLWTLVAPALFPDRDFSR